MNAQNVYGFVEKYVCRPRNQLAARKGYAHMLHLLWTFNLDGDAVTRYVEAIACIISS